jgi:hypothetical protein
LTSAKAHLDKITARLRKEITREEIHYLLVSGVRSKFADDQSYCLYLKLAVDELRQPGDLTHLPRGLLSCAALHRLTGDHHLAQRDLDEALRIATRGSMRLHEADCHLESARLCLVTGDRASARKAWEAAKAMVEEMGYHRRDEEVKENERQLKAD